MLIINKIQKYLIEYICTNFVDILTKTNNCSIDCAIEQLIK